jgi:hypothetical protein
MCRSGYPSRLMQLVGFKCSRVFAPRVRISTCIVKWHECLELHGVSSQ